MASANRQWTIFRLHWRWGLKILWSSKMQPMCMRWKVTASERSVTLSRPFRRASISITQKMIQAHKRYSWIPTFMSLSHKK